MKQLVGLVVLISCLLTTLLPAGFVLSQPNVGDIDPSLWTTPVKVIENTQNVAWWIGEHEGSTGSNDWVPIAQLLSQKINEDPGLNLIFTDIFANPYNNTIFVSMTKVDDKTVSQIQNLISIPNGVHLKVRKSIASKIQLNEWEQQLNLDFLRKNGINAVSLSKSMNGTIVIGLNDTSTNILSKLFFLINGKVPTGALVIRKEFTKQVTTVPSDLMGGVSIAGEDQPGIYHSGTLGFIVKSGTTTYAILAGHSVMNNGGHVYWFDENNFQTELGTSRPIPPFNPPDKYSDSALVQISISAASRVYLKNNWPNFNIVGKQNYNQQYVGECISKQGYTTNQTSGIIMEKPSQVWNPWYNVNIRNQIHSNYYAQQGDSGGPVFASINGQCYAMGITSMIDTGLPPYWSWYSPCDGIETDYGMSFTWNIPITYFSDNFENFPTSPSPYGSWTTSSGGGGTITKSHTYYHGGSYSAKVSSTTIGATANAYQNFNLAYQDNDLHFSTYIRIDPSVKNSDYNYIFHATYPPPFNFDILQTGYRFSGSTCYLVNGKATGWENVGTINTGSWVKVEAYLDWKIGKVAYYIGGTYKGQYTPYSWGIYPLRITIGDDSSSAEKMLCYFDDMAIDNKPFIWATSPIFKDDFQNWPLTPNYGNQWYWYEGNGGNIDASIIHSPHSVYVQSISTSTYAYAYHTFTTPTGSKDVHFKVSIYIESACIPTDYNYVFHVYDSGGSHELLACGYYKDSNGYWYLRNYDGITHSWSQWGSGPLPLDEWFQIDAFYYIAEGQVVYYINGGTMGISRVNAAGTGYLPGRIYFGDDSATAEKMACYFNDLLIDAAPLP